MNNNTITMSFDEWWDTFEPQDNPNNAGNGISVDEIYPVYETLGKDIEAIKEIIKQTPLKVWSWIECDGVQVISNGMRKVNVMGYIVTLHPAVPDTHYEVIDEDDLDACA